MKHFQNENNQQGTGWELVGSAWTFLNTIFDHAALVMTEQGLHQKSLVLLALLDRADTPQELAHLLRTPPSTLSHMLRELEEKALVARSFDAKDRRKVRLRRTEAGEIALGAGIAAINVTVAAALEHLNTEEKATLKEAIPLLLRLTVMP